MTESLYGRDFHAEALERHYWTPEARAARLQEARDQADIVCRAVACPECLAPAGAGCFASGLGIHFGRGLAFARAGGPLM